jgi:hypothetical protein
MSTARIVAAGFSIVAALAAATAHGTAQRTFVASTGNDANPCTITAPCWSFPRALTETSPGGEVIVKDSAGYGAFTIDRSVSIVAPPGVHAGISVFAPFSGVTIDAPGAKVALRGLSISGQGGVIGIWMLRGAELHVENCVISGLATGLRTEAGATSIKDTIIRGNSGAGAEIESGTVTAHFDHVRVQNNGGSGILIDQALANVRASIRNVVVSDNGGVGIEVDATNSLTVVDIDSTEVTSNGWAGSAGGILVTAHYPTTAEVSVANSLVARNHGTGVLVAGFPTSQSVAHVSVTDSTLTGNYGDGIRAEAPFGTTIASRNTITRNAGAGLHEFYGTLYSTGDNRVQGNFGGETSGTISSLVPK